MQPASNRPIQPVNSPVYNNGKPIILLSPSGSARNIHLIYQALEKCKPTQRIRAAYTWKGQPYIAFASKKRFNAGITKRHNILAQRRELMNILANTADAALLKIDTLDLSARQQVESFRDHMRQAYPSTDLRARDLLRFLSELDQQLLRQETRRTRADKLREHYGSSPKDKRNATSQRIRQFLEIDAGLQKSLCAALQRDDDGGPGLAEKSLRAVAGLFRKIRNHRDINLSSAVNSFKGREDLRIFARRWQEFRMPFTPRGINARMESFTFDAYSWCRLLDDTASLIIKADRRQCKIHEKGGAGIDGARVVYPGDRSPDASSNSQNESGMTRQHVDPQTVRSSDSSLVMSSPLDLRRAPNRPDPADSPMTTTLRRSESVRLLTKGPLDMASDLATARESTQSQSISVTELDSDSELSVGLLSTVGRRAHPGILIDTVPLPVGSSGDSVELARGGNPESKTPAEKSS